MSFAAPLLRFNSCCRACLALSEWKTPQVLAFRIQEIKREVGQVFGSSFGQCGLQGREIGRAIVIECDTSPSIMQSSRAVRGLRDGSKIRRPVEPFAGPHDGLAAGNTQLHAIAIELDLVDPIGPDGRPADPPAELGAMNCGIFDAARFCARRFASWRVRRSSGSALLALPFRFECQTASDCSCLPGQHERFWPPAFAGGDLLHGASGGD